MTTESIESLQSRGLWKKTPRFHIREASTIAHNEERWIKETVQSVLDHLKPKRFVVIADSCTDGTVGIVKGMAKHNPAIKLYEEENKGVGTSMYSALEKLRGKFVFHITGDITLIQNPHPMLELMEPDVFQVTGKCRHICGECGANVLMTKMHYWGTSQSLAILRRKVVLDIPEGRISKFEDMELCLHARKQGWRCNFDDRNIYGFHHWDLRDETGALAGHGVINCPWCREKVSQRVIRRLTTVKISKAEPKPERKKLEKKLLEYEIFVLAHNDELLLGSVLDSIREYCPNCFRVTVIDDSSLDGTLEIAKEKADKVVTVGTRNRGANRQLALKMCKKELLLFVDSDVILCGNPECAAEAFKNRPNLVALRLGNYNPHFGKVINLHSYWGVGLGTTFVNVKLAKRAGGFSEVHYGEDADFGMKTQFYGFESDAYPKQVG